MSKRPTEPSDWSGASEALFRSGRSHHAPNAADRERVRRALAQRLAAAPPGAEVPVSGASGSGVAVGSLVKLGLGLLAIMTAAFALVWANLAPKPAQPEAPALQVSAGTSALAAAPSASAILAPARAPAQDAPAYVPVQRALRSAPVHEERRARDRAPVAKPPARAAARTAPTRTAQELTAPDAQPGANLAGSGGVAAGAASDSVVARASPGARQPHPEAVQAQSVAQASARAEPSPARARPAADRAVAQTADARAELSFVQQIHAALLNAKSTTVLVLCTEHERRWPAGMFVQEREGLRAIASCRAGARGANARARAFVASYPNGALTPRVREACRAQLTAAGADHDQRPTVQVDSK